MPLFGKKKDSKLIVNYMKIIEQSIIPMINENLELSINNYPEYEKIYSATYEDNQNNIMVEFSSGNINIEEKGELFVTVSYNRKTQRVGLVDTNDPASIRDLSTILLESLHELGFETKADKEEKERQAKQAELDKKAKELADAEAKKQAQDIKNDEDNRKEEVPEEPEEEPEASFEEQFNASHNEIFRSLDYLAKLPGEDYKMEVNYLLFSIGTNQPAKNVGMNLTKVSGNNFLVETYKIKPEVQTIMNMDRIVEYSDKVTKALNAIPVVTLTDNKGRPMEIPPEEAPEDFVTID